MVFTAVNPMYTHQNQEEVQYDLDKHRIPVYKNTWRIYQNTVYWCNLKLTQRKGLQFYQTRSNAIALFSTLPAICIEKMVDMKTGDPPSDTTSSLERVAACSSGSYNQLKVRSSTGHQHHRNAPLLASIVHRGPQSN